MEVVAYDPDTVCDLSAAYNRGLEGVPHCYRGSVEEFAEAVAPIVGGKASHERLHSEAASLARQGARIVGFIHTAFERPEKAEPQLGGRGR